MIFKSYIQDPLTECDWGTGNSLAEYLLDGFAVILTKL